MSAGAAPEVIFMGMDGHYFIRGDADDFAAPFDWIFGAETIKRVSPPRTVFIKTDYLPRATDHLLALDSSFVVITGASDFSPTITFPSEQYAILQSPNCAAWWAENNLAEHPKMRALPVGLTYHSRAKQAAAEELLFRLRREVAPQRRTEIFAHWRDRTRNVCGPAHEHRATLAARIATAPAGRFSFLTPFGREIEQPAYFAELIKHQFVLCPNGNGVDAAPRAWEAMILKVIPIVLSNPCMNSIYDCLPAVLLRSWDDVFKDDFYDQYAAEISRAEAIMETDRYLYFLTRGYWWGQILSDTL